MLPQRLTSALVATNIESEMEPFYRFGSFMRQNSEKFKDVCLGRTVCESVVRGNGSTGYFPLKFSFPQITCFPAPN